MRSEMPTQPTVDPIPPLRDNPALAGSFGLCGGLGRLLAKLGLQLDDLLEHLVDLQPLVLGNHLTVEPQLQPCELQVDQGLCGRPPPQLQSGCPIAAEP